MHKRNIMIVVGVILALCVTLTAKALLNTDEKDDFTGTNDLHTQYEHVKASGKPLIIVISYDGECCPATKNYLDNYNREARQFINQFEDKASSLFINYALITQEDQELFMTLVETYGITQLPSLVLSDSNGKSVYSTVGLFDYDEAVHHMDRLVQ